LHEPRGIVSANSGDVLVADGAGSGSWTAPDAPATILIGSESDFPTPSGGIITLAADTDYLITASFTTANRFVVGDNTLVRATNSTQVTLTYSGAGIMFTGTDASFILENISLACAFGTVFSATSTTGTHRLNLFAVTIVICNIVGTIDGMDALAINRLVVGNIITDGLTFLNSINIFSLLQAIVTIAAGDMFDLGTATFNAVSLSHASFVLNGASTLLKGAAASANINTGGLGSVLNTRIIGVGTSLSGITTDDALWQFFLNDDILDTRPDALTSNTAGTTITIAAVNTPVKIAGTWVDTRSSQFTNTTDGRATYDGGKDAVLPITIAVNAEPVSGTNKDFTIYVAINGTIVSDYGVPGRADSGSPVNVAVPFQEKLSTSDFVEVFLENNTDGVDFTVNGAVLRIN